jgi:hypothetical protein
MSGFLTLSNIKEKWLNNQIPKESTLGKKCFATCLNRLKRVVVVAVVVAAVAVVVEVIIVAEQWWLCCC